MKLLRPYYSQKIQSAKSELKAAVFTGGQVQPASGAVPRYDLKGDVKTPLFLIEDKSTNQQSFSIVTGTWRKLANQAWNNNRRPCLRINFLQGPTLYVLDETSFGEFLEIYAKCKKCDKIF
jgi:hypothetical protein